MKAILWREFKVTFGSLFSVVMQLAIPLFMLVFFATAFSSNIGRLKVGSAGFSYLEFFTPGLFGYVTFLVFNLGFAYIRIDRQTGMLSIITLSRASLSGYFWGKFSFQVLLTFAKILLLGIVAALLANRLPPIKPVDVPLLCLAAVLGAAIWFSLGMIGGVLLRRDDIREAIVTFATLILTFASSMYYNPRVAPMPIRWLASFNPLTYVCDLLRGCYLGALPSNWPYQVALLLVLAVGLSMVAIRTLNQTAA